MTYYVYGTFIERGRYKFKTKEDALKFEKFARKNMKTSFSTPQETIVSIPNTGENKEASESIGKVEQFTNKHPGAVNSPMVGTFYASASPGAKPFVSVGDIVAEGDVVCIVEAMKMMNEIKSEFSGKVLSINVENAEPVEYGQSLFELSK